MSKITKRQEDVLLNIFLSDQAYDGERTREPWESYTKRHGQPVPEWGRPVTHQGRGRAGGARTRMIERLMDAGLMRCRWSPSGYRIALTGSLPVKGLQYLLERFPALPGLTEAIAGASKEEADAAAAKAKEREEQEAARLKRAEARAAERRERMAAVLRDFQVRHDLTQNQLEAMWLRIVEEENRI